MSDIPLSPGLIAEMSAAPPRSAWLDWVSTVDHKRIGALYLLTTLFLLLRGRH